MIFVQHRANKLQYLKRIPSKYGLEIDVRSIANKLIIQHDPLKKGINLKHWLKFYNHKLLIINIKEEGLEPSILKALNKAKIKNFFFLDQSFPFIIKKSKLLSKKSAVRFNLKDIHFHCNINGLDRLFYISSINKNVIETKKANFKICIVSPELQGKDLKK